MPVSILLVQNGVFPMSPNRPQTAVSVDLLDIYQALFERSCDAINALASALHTIYDRRGFHVLSSQGQLAKDPFRAGLQQAVQWYSNLRAEVQKRVNAALAEAETSLYPAAPISTTECTPPTSNAVPIASMPHPPAPPVETKHVLTPGRAARILRERCPACFGLEEWGRPLEDGGDVQLGADGCFSYRHIRRAGDGPISYDPSYFLSKEKVDRAGDRIVEARKKKPAKLKSLIPQDVLDACNDSFDAANEKKQKVDPKYHDASGVFVLACRHSQVLFLCNIDTPGEQQKYLVALLEEMNELLPPAATILHTYDIGCVSDRSLDLYPILTEGLRERLSFALNVMHSFRHQWVCQLVYSPRFRRGMGLTDGEGVERLWSRIRKLIPITRHQWNSRRIWMLDQYAAFVNEDGCNRLGDWILRQKDKNLPAKYKAATKVLRQCRVPINELRSQWEAQKAAQTSFRKYAPARMRRELDKVLALQTQIEAVEQSIHDAKKSLTGQTAVADSLVLLGGLEKTHAVLSEQADRLYSTLNIHKDAPELQGLPLAFVRILHAARDLKAHIQDCGQKSIDELLNLRQAVAGQKEPSGTKLHQSTMRAISSRKPALMRSIAKFNAYCEELEELRPPGCNIAIPSPLPTTLAELRDSHLCEDVYISASGEIPRWVDDPDVRDGIRNMHIVDRCIEEEARLKLECTSMSTWLLREQAIVAKAIESITDPTLELALLQRRRMLHYLGVGWGPILQRGHRVSVTGAADTIQGPAQPLADTSAVCHPQADASFPPPSALARAAILPVEAVEDLFDARVDTSFLQVLQNRNNSLEIIPQWYTRTVVGMSGRSTLKFDVDDQRRISAPTGRLNGFGLNALAASLLNVFSEPYSPMETFAKNCAVFSTYDLPRIHNNRSNELVWRHAHPTAFWDKPVWLIPIHRPREEHWVLVVAYIRQQRLVFFDSLGETGGWRRDLQDVMRLITRLTQLSSKNGHPLHVNTQEEPWIARPFLPPGNTLQTNGHDCGIWVLCMMAAVLRGYEVTGIAERQMGLVRDTLMDHILTLPFT
ncbi:hypothetical protein B0H14DRAFT_2502920 [Mycena olivaceomarginata]|nr:hypothetical protein B0H14DRAFT_2502920 [Mycena olivaceomarginata]